MWLHCLPVTAWELIVLLNAQSVIVFFIRFCCHSDRSTPCLHEMGHFIIPTMCDILQLQNFLQSQAQEARRRTRLKNLLEAEEEDIISSCLQDLSLRSLSKEPSVSSNQMIPCCRRLMEEKSPQMQGLHLCVSHFYSVMQDGDLCIPWDWKG